MYFEKSELEEKLKKVLTNFETKEDYISMVTKNLLNNWIVVDKGRNLFQYAGGFWEVLLPILRKYQPELLKTYESITGEFNYSNPEIEAMFNYGDDALNLFASISYINQRIESYATANDIHLITLEDDKIMPYMPNQSVEHDKYWGRESNA